MTRISSTQRPNQRTRAWQNLATVPQPGVALKVLVGSPWPDAATSSSLPRRSDPCVRVRYANFCHIDIVPYVVLQNGAQAIINRTTNSFEDTNPVRFTAWLQDKNDLTNRKLRKVLRLLKYLRDQRDAFSIKSVLLTTPVGSVIDSWRALDPEHYAGVPTTLVHLIEELDGWLQARPYKPSISDPNCPSTSFDHRWTHKLYSRFRDDIHA